MTSPFEEYQKTHRMPRLLVVATHPMHDNDRESAFDKKAMEWLLEETSCYCIKYNCTGEQSMHLLVPGKYGQGRLTTIKNVYLHALAENRAYDAIIVDSEICAEEIRRWASTQQPKPGVLFYTRRDAETAKRLQADGNPAFCQSDVLADDTNRSKFDEVFAAELGEKGLARLACQPEEISSHDQWLSLPKSYMEVAPSGTIRQVDQLQIRDQGFS